MGFTCYPLSPSFSEKWPIRRVIFKQRGCRFCGDRLGDLFEIFAYVILIGPVFRFRLEGVPALGHVLVDGIGGRLMFTGSSAGGNGR